jgi:hypothetical protein
MIKDANQRSIFRWIHIVFGIPIIGYVYSPFKELPNYAPVVRFISIPVLVLTGLWMWKGNVVRRLISKRSARAASDTIPNGNFCHAPDKIRCALLTGEE